MTLKFQALPTDQVRKLQSGGLDANGLAPERHRSDSNSNPCRHCVSFIPRDEGGKTAERIFEDSAIAYIHMRSATNNCYQCRIEHR